MDPFDQAVFYFIFAVYNGFVINADSAVNVNAKILSAFNSFQNIGGCQKSFCRNTATV